MARWTEHKRSTIDEVVAQWRDRCLQQDGSLLFEGPTWTEPHLDRLYQRFNRNPLQDDRSFEEKFKEQIGSEPDLVRLGAEVLGVYLLFAAGAISTHGKRALIGRVLSWADEQFDESTPLWRAMAEGIGNPGLGFNVNRPVQVAYLVDFARRWKGAPSVRRQQFLDDPWELRSFADDTDETTPGMRHIVLHLLRPDEFERIASGAHKKQIGTALEGLLPKERPEDLDERLLGIRRQLEKLLPDGNTPDGGLDFYYQPLKSLWDQSATADEGMSSLAALTYKRQMILYGPPGTGKTYKAKALAERIIHQHALRNWSPARYFGQRERLEEIVRTHVKRLQLHPAYSYEDFIRGLRLDDGATTYQPGYLLRLIDEIDREGTSAGEAPLPWVLILDEINRTDLTRLLGEAFSLLEDRETTVELIGQTEGAPTSTVRLPNHLFVIGTMNLIDQSVEQIDFALRRRFLWERLGFERDVIPAVVRERWLARTELARRYPWERLEPEIEWMAEYATRLNREIGVSDVLGPQYEIGHTYFFDIVAFVAEWPRLQSRSRPSHFLWTKGDEPLPPLQDLWERSLRPLLEQYLAGVDPQSAQHELNRLRSVLYYGESR